MILGFLIMGLGPIAVVCLGIYFIIYLCTRKKEGKQPFLRHLARYALLGCFVTLVYLTIFWSGIMLDSPFRMLNLRPFVWVSQVYAMGYKKMLWQLGMNVFMFAPYGLLLPLAFKGLRKWWKTDLIVFVTSFLIEFVQYFIGRSCDIDDLIMNFAGGCIGYGLFCLTRVLFKEKLWYKKMTGVNE